VGRRGALTPGSLERSTVHRTTHGGRGGKEGTSNTPETAFPQPEQVIAGDHSDDYNSTPKQVQRQEERVGHHPEQESPEEGEARYPEGH
jgi:hypothetical protein